MKQHRGHIIILKPGLDLTKYEQSDFAQKNKQHVERLREILSFIKPGNYRGTGREHFEPSSFWVDDNGILQDWVDRNRGAYKRFFSMEEMRKVYELIHNIEAMKS